MAAHKSRAQQAAERREELRGIAVHHFAEKGFEGTSLEDVAAEAGVTKGLLYHYFGSKEALFLEGIESFPIETVIEAIPAVVEEGTPVGDIIRLVVSEARRVLAAHRAEVRLLVRSAVSGSEEALRRLERLVTRFEELLGVAFAKSGDFDPDLDAGMAASQLISSLVFQQLVPELMRDRHDPDAVAEQLVRTTTRGYSTAPD
ncbi:MAG: TetR/AcrR family transcriptional regulator [Acidimicrobiia bacterium]|nr:TetR/AcrR family transcriptional regulator [Acidimicrobiia bacterium]